MHSVLYVTITLFPRQSLLSKTVMFKSLVQLFAGMTAVGGHSRLTQDDEEDALEAKVMVKSASSLLPHLKSLNVRILIELATKEMV
jgi:hypothetical protein